VTHPSRGWTVYCEQDAAETIEAMPPGMRSATVRFLVDLAETCGAAIDAGDPPSGTPIDESGLVFGITLPDQPVIIEYLVVADIRELRVTTVVPFF
jgi:hypothetical protein